MPHSIAPPDGRRFVRISALSHLLTHTRFAITLRTVHPPIAYHTLLLFRLSPVISSEREAGLIGGTADKELGKNDGLDRKHDTDAAKEQQNQSLNRGKTTNLIPPNVQLYCMESTCPHLGAPLSHAKLTTSQQIDASPDSPSTLQPCSESLAQTTQTADANADPDPFLPELLSISSLSNPSSYNPTLTKTPLTEEEKKTVICPWHLYDFDLEDGGSSTGLGVCVYAVEVRKGDVRSGVERQDGEEKVGVKTKVKPRMKAKIQVKLEESAESIADRNEADGWDVWIEQPEHEDRRSSEESGWEIVNVVPVSEDFADPPPLKNSLSVADLPPALASLSLSVATNHTTIIHPLPPLPKTLVSAALLILQTPSASQKLELTKMTLTKLRTGGFSSIKGTKGDIKAATALFAPLFSPTDASLEEGHDGLKNRGEDMPGWPGHFVPPREEGVKTVDPATIGKRGRGGNEKSRVLMLHALANIEQWAIDLSWDIIARFADFSINGEKLPVEFFLDWAKVAEDEAKHFSLLSRRLEELGSFYGAHTVHAGLWTSALDTSHSLLSRLAIIHLVAEARGLDVNPMTIEKFKKAGDEESVRVLSIIHNDEITHVTTGHRWFTWICQRIPVDPIQQFRAEVRHNFRGRIKGPFNTADRLTAGMSNEYYEDLEGHMRFDKPWGQAGGGKDGGDGEKGSTPEGCIDSKEGDLRIHPRLT